MLTRAIRRRRNDLRHLRREYPRSIWSLTGGTFINSFGGSMVFPLFTLFFTQKFGISVAEAGLLAALFTVGGLIGGPLGGWLADRVGRKGVMIFSLCAEAVFSMGMALAPTLPLLVLAIFCFGLTVPMFWPASSATIADLVKPEKRAGAYGLIRVAANLGVAFGPLVAGVLLAVQQQPDGSTPPNAYLPLFVMDALTSLIFAFIIWRRLRETKPQVAPQTATNQAAAGGGYGRVFRDSPFMFFIILSGLVGVVYSQMNTTFGVYLTRSLGYPASVYTAMLSTNAAMVVLFQFPLARWVDKQDRSAMLALGAALYAIGFGFIGFASTLFMFWTAVVILTIGEMVIVPAAQTVSADLAPIDMRGRYQATFGLINNFFYGFGPIIGGYLYDIGHSQLIWFGSLILGLAVAAGFRAFGPKLRAREALAAEV
jgi:MFS family permease